MTEPETISFVFPVVGEKKPWKERLSACDGCDLCGDRCVSGFPISQFEYRRIRAMLERDDTGEIASVEAQEKELPWPGMPEFTYQACRFRDAERGRCSIYANRPLVCRLFGHVEWLPCPAGIILETAPEGRALMEWYGGRELKTYEEWRSLEEADKNLEPVRERFPVKIQDGDSVKMSKNLSEFNANEEGDPS